MNVRDAVLKQLEASRARGEIGSSLQAEIAITAPTPVYEALASIGDDLRFVMITSRATVREEQRSGLHVKVGASGHPKCGRCWHYRADVNEAGLCGRCESNLHGAGEPRRHA